LYNRYYGSIVVEFVIYDLPGRDCAALASNGELPAGAITTYKSQYIDPIVTLFTAKPSNIRLVLVIEPDSLPNLATNLNTHNCNSSTASDYPAGISYAIAKLSVISNTYLYLDAAHGGWLGWPNNQALIIPIFQNVMSLAKGLNSAATFRGFASSVANYSPYSAPGACPITPASGCQTNNGVLQLSGNSCLDESTYISQLNSHLSSASLPTQWIVDTSRSGRASIRTVWGSWCNIKNSGIGPRPSTNPGTNVDAFVWVKPPGESDGVSSGTVRLDGFCDPTTGNGVDSLSGAPQAGQWFDAEFQMLVKNANPAL